MQPRFKILNSREKKSILKQLEKQYSIKSLKLYHIFLQRKDKIYMINRDFANISLYDLRINSIGLNFCTLANDEVRLSVEGSQIVGPLAKKNVLNTKAINKWLSGNNLKTKKSLNGFIIIKHKDDFYGVGRFKQGIILNFIPKERRIKCTQ